ncbi:hypothetical protein GCM10011512_13190 [Tersicoccus solisilvae]|uniref:Protein-glutamine gamma-glutamyltransferase-like C-terminal domain-containing protein n=1 Tax=Tersicoccus solisilvae TaxID=1882339 RepID=A0ABQ1NZ83_9MICC|nr:DUF4129 domain-containing protein [Tersicoccus solisilvae]GGC87601.1 hypothetical protein GCM10011512_13190 [Tersicoccus solisilvae]
MTVPGLAVATRVGTLVAAAVPRDVPVVPDDGTARRWAEQELARPEYQDAKPGPLDAVLDAIGRWLDDVLTGLDPSGANPWLIAVVLLLLVGVVVLVLVVRPRLNRAAARRASVFDAELPLDADAHRALARAAAARGDHATAVIEAFRALVRAAQERTDLPEGAGRTVDEVTGDLSGRHPTEREAVSAAGRRFNDVRYGDAPATAADHERITALDQRLARAGTNRRDDVRAGAGPVVPR